MEILKLFFHQNDFVNENSHTAKLDHNKNIRLSEKIWLIVECRKRNCTTWRKMDKLDYNKKISLSNNISWL